MIKRIKQMKKRNKILLGVFVFLWTLGWLIPSTPEYNDKPEKVSSAKEETKPTPKPSKSKPSFIEAKIGQEMKFGSCSIVLEGFAVYAETKAQRKDTDHWVKLGGYYINSFWKSPEKCWSDEYFEVKVNGNGLTAWRNWSNDSGVYTHYLGTLWDGDTRIDVIGKDKTYRYHLRGDYDTSRSN